MGRTTKRVLHLTEDLGIGGLERILASIALHLDRQTYDPHVWCLARGGEVAEELQQQGVKVRVLGLSSCYHPAGILALARQLRATGFHIVHTHGYFAGTIGRLAAALAGLPVLIHHVHSTYHEYEPRHRFVEKSLAHLTDRVICVTSAVRDFVKNGEGIPTGKTAIIHNGVARPDRGMQAAEIRRERQQLGIGPEEKVVASVGSLTANKGHSVLLRSIAQVTSQVPGTRLIVAGDGPLREELAAEARKLGVAAAVTWAGVRTDVYRLLQLSDLFVLPSLYREGLSLAVLEAMASNLPVIATNLGGMSEAVRNGKTGLLVSPGEVRELASAMADLLRDEGRSKSMGAEGRGIYEKHFTLQGMMERIEGLYQDCLNARRGTRARQVSSGIDARVLNAGDARPD
jgi:glycosyltransferase involved in cell wall biosynthesis